MVNENETMKRRLNFFLLQRFWNAVMHYAVIYSKRQSRQMAVRRGDKNGALFRATNYPNSHIF